MKTTKTKIISFLFVLSLLFCEAGEAFAATFSWTDVSGNNAKNGLISKGKGAETNISVSETGRLYAAFQDKKERIYASYFNGKSWTKLLGTANTVYIARNGDKASIAAKDDDLYVAYKDLDASRKARIRRWNGSAWSDVADANHPLGYVSNLEGFEPALCFDNSGDNLFVAFRDEESGQRIKVLKWNESLGWSEVADWNNPSGLISGSVASEVDIKASKVSDDMFVAYEDIANGGLVRVKKWDGSAWTDISDANHSGGLASIIAGFSPSIDADNSGNLYLTYTGRNAKNTYVQKWNGSVWENVGGSIIVSGRTIESTLAVDDRSYLYLAYSQKAAGAWRVRVKVWDGTRWLDAKDGKSQNISKGKGKGDPSLAVFGNSLYVSFTDAKHGNKARIKMLNFAP